MKRTHRCPKCEHDEILHARRVFVALSNEGLCCVNFNGPRGMMELYACRRCGFAESYVLDPASVPAPTSDTEVLTAAPGTYR